MAFEWLYLFRLFVAFCHFCVPFSVWFPAVGVLDCLSCLGVSGLSVGFHTFDHLFGSSPIPRL